jgi:hypothetical protein
MIKASNYTDPFELMKSVGQVALMEYFLNEKVGTGLVRSPFRKDDNPTCSF